MKKLVICQYTVFLPPTLYLIAKMTDKKPLNEREKRIENMMLFCADEKSMKKAKNPPL